MKAYGDVQILGKRVIFELNSNPDPNEPFSGWVERAIVGQNISKGNVLYRNSNGKWYKASASSRNVMPASAVAVENATSNSYCTMVRNGLMYNDGWNFSNSELYVSLNGNITDIKPGGYGIFLQSVGFAMTTNTAYLHFNPLLLEIG